MSRARVQTAWDNGGGAPADEPATHPIEADPLRYRATNLGFLLKQRGDSRGARLAYSAAARWGDLEGRRLGAALTQCV